MKIPNNFMEEALKNVLEEYGLTEDMSLKDCVEKQIAKKPVETMICDTATWKCPCCGNQLYSGQKYCDECGQAILDDWE